MYFWSEEDGFDEEEDLEAPVALAISLDINEAKSILEAGVGVAPGRRLVCSVKKGMVAGAVDQSVGEGERLELFLLERLICEGEVDG